ncbi:MAG: hypothetical protein GY716_09860 [bacterium]|nr:hypothetical protein [bacterium]
MPLLAQRTLFLVVLFALGVSPATAGVVIVEHTAVAEAHTAARSETQSLPPLTSGELFVELDDRPTGDGYALGYARSEFFQNGGEFVAIADTIGLSTTSFARSTIQVVFELSQTMYYHAQTELDLDGAGFLDGGTTLFSSEVEDIWIDDHAFNRGCFFGPPDQLCDSSFPIWTGTITGVLPPGRYTLYMLSETMMCDWGGCLDLNDRRVNIQFFPCPDVDGDGACETVDNCPGANPDQADADEDGLGDACDPCFGASDVDGDGDGRCNETDNCPAVSNPAQEDDDADAVGNACDPCFGTPDIDADGDSLCDAFDNCPDVVNLDQGDGDADGVGDLCDPCAGDTNVDTDHDGLCNGLDNCHLPNPGQEDADADGVGDPCDPCTGSVNIDTDGDGLCNGLDNCFLPNPRQEDADGDGVGNPCDPCFGDSDYDVDGDGTCEDVDNCPTEPNPAQRDSDTDGTGDACDNCPVQPNPGQDDNDNDGEGNSCDCAPFDPGLRNPAAVRLTVDRFSGEGAARLSWASAPGSHTYSITRGSTVLLTSGNYGSCIATDVVDPAFDDFALPAPGTTRTFLVQGVSDECGPGTLGVDGSGAERANASPGGCP